MFAVAATCGCLCPLSGHGQPHVPGRKAGPPRCGFCAVSAGDALPRLAQAVLVLGREMGEEVTAHAVEVRRTGDLQAAASELGDDRERAAGVVFAWVALDEAVALEAVREARQTA